MILVIALSSMSLISCGGKLIQTRIIKQTIPPIPAPPDYYDVEWTMDADGNYKLTEQGSKNLLKNMELLKDYVEQIKQIIEGLR